MKRYRGIDEIQELQPLDGIRMHKSSHLMQHEASKTCTAAWWKSLNRRTFLARGGVGLGSMALSSLLPKPAFAADFPSGHQSGYRGLPGLPHFAPKIKRVIWLCMAGGPSHLETFDYKPRLAELHDQPMPESYTKG